MKSLRGHKEAVNGISVHPTGLLGLSVGHDRQLRMWDLAKGRCQYTARLEAEAEAVLFGPLGRDYLLQAGSKVGARKRMQSPLQAVGYPPAAHLIPPTSPAR